MRVDFSFFHNGNLFRTKRWRCDLSVILKIDFYEGFRYFWNFIEIEEIKPMFSIMLFNVTVFITSIEEVSIGTFSSSMKDFVFLNF